MNRIKLSPLAATPQTNPPQTPVSQPGVVESKACFSLSNASVNASPETALFLPMHLEKNYAYPLIIWLHSDGQTSAQVFALMQRISLRNYMAVAPQAPVGNFQCGFFWEQDYDSIATAEASIYEAIESVSQRYNIHPGRIFLAGSGGGGTMAFRIGLRRTSQFAGIISLNSPLPEEHSPLSNWKQCRNMPIFWSHHVDSEDPENTSRMCRDFQQLYSGGFLNLSAREYPNMQVLEAHAPSAVNQWIMEQVQSAIL